MSSWERSRFIPWDRIPQEGTNLEYQKERIFRELQRETIQDELLQQERRTAEPLVDGDTSITAQAETTKTTATTTSQKIPYSNMELLRQAAFGATIGSITGAVFGFMDGMRSVGEQPILVNASNMAKGRYLLQGTTRSATVFGVFFGGFHVLKYGIRVAMDPGEVTEIGVAGAASLGALMSRPAYRASMPYAAMLIGMDAFNLAMRKFS